MSYDISYNYRNYVLTLFYDNPKINNYRKIIVGRSTETPDHYVRS